MRSSPDRLATFSRVAFVAAAWAFVGCLIVQLFLVGLDVFEVIGPHSEIHRAWAYTYGPLSVLLVLLAGLGRLPRNRMLLAVGLLVLFALQTYLPTLVEQAPLLAAFHSVNALAVFWLALHIARHAADPVEPQLQGGS